MTEVFIHGRAKGSLPVGNFQTGLITSTAYLKFPLNFYRGNSANENRFISDPSPCLVYGNDQIWVLLKTLKHYNGTIDDSDTPEELMEKVVQEDGTIVNRLTTIPKGSIGIGGICAESPNEDDKHEIVKNTLRTLNKHLSYGLYLTWSLVDRHPKTIERVKKFGFTPKIFVSKEKLISTKIKYLEDGCSNNAVTVQEYLNKTSFAFHHHEEAMKLLDFFPSREAYAIHTIGLPPTVMYSPNLTWLIMGTFRSGFNLASRNTEYGQSLLQKLESTVSYETLTKALNDYDYDVLVEIFSMLVPHFGRAYYDTVGAHQAEFCKFVSEGGWLGIDTPYEVNWSLDKTTINTHGGCLVPWEQSLYHRYVKTGIRNIRDFTPECKEWLKLGKTAASEILLARR